MAKRRERKNFRRWAAKQMQRREEISLEKIAPSVLTLCGLCSGASAIPLALMHEWKFAVGAIFAAMVFDMLDGRAARWLGADSEFGTQLDSLADLVSFGLAPAVVAYIWSLSKMGPSGWIAALIFCACSAIRLARFNVQAARDEGATVAHPYFVGLPTPAAAALMMLPLMLSFVLGSGVFRNPMFYLALIAFTSIMMVSTIPTPSLKHVRMTRQLRIAIGMFLFLFVPTLIALPWATLSMGLALYLATIPLVIRGARIAARHHADALEADEELLETEDGDDEEPSYHRR
jgi:CDP-diacylglycerol--serine O-phosphatidyltransferase